MITESSRPFSVTSKRTTIARRTRLMKEIEAKLNLPEGMSLRQYLKQCFNSGEGLSELASRLEISKATLGYWLLKLDLRLHRICVDAGETVKIVSQHEEFRRLYR